MPKYPSTEEGRQHAEQSRFNEHTERFTDCEQSDDQAADGCGHQATQIPASRHRTGLGDEGQLEHQSSGGFGQQLCSSNHTEDPIAVQPWLYPQGQCWGNRDTMLEDDEQGEVATLKRSYQQATQPSSPKFAPTPGRAATPLISHQLPSPQRGGRGESPTQAFSDGHVQARLGDTHLEYKLPNLSELLAVEAGIIKDNHVFNGEPSIPIPSPGGNDQSIAPQISVARVETRRASNQGFNIDWSDFRRQEIWNKVKACRMLIHPKIEQVRILPYGVQVCDETWITVVNPSYPVEASVFAVESGPLQIGCTIVRHETSGCFFFNNAADQVIFYNCSKHPFSLTQPGGETLDPISPWGYIVIPAGIWSLSILGESLIEFEVMKRISWDTTKAESSRAVTSTDENLSKRRKLSKAGKAITTGTPIVEPSQNPILELQEGGTLPIDGMYSIKYLRTIYSNSVVRVLLVEYSGQNWTDERVVKVLTREPYNAVEAGHAWMREYDIHSALDHPCIVKLLGGDARLQSLYIEHVEAKSLAKQLGKGMSFTGSRQDALKVMKDMASALAHVHAKGFVHADFKPDNVLYSPTRGAVLIDFGLAFRHGNPSRGSGTPWYIPPEFAQGFNSRGPASDIWALGVTMLWLLGHISLPDRTWKTWKINDMHPRGKPATPHQEAMDRMYETIKRIAEARSKLDLGNKLESIVSKTLDEDMSARITAESLCKELSGLEITPS